jgi:hypothetical protein
VQCRYIQPNTPIYDLTTEHAIVHGRFFYPSSTSQLTAFAIVHSFILRPGPTHQLTNERFTFLRRMMAMWFNCYREDPLFDPSRFPHIPDVRTENGLMDIIALGNILELATVLDRRCYMSSGLHWTERLEMGASRMMYRQLQSIIALNFVLCVDGQPIRPSAIFQRSLVEFAAAVVVYKEDMHAARKIPSCSPAKVKEKMVTLFRSNYPELLPNLLGHIDRRSQHLNWTGPTISIMMRTEQHRWFQHRKSNTPAMVINKPLHDFPDVPKSTAKANDGDRPQISNNENMPTGGDDAPAAAKHNSGPSGSGEQQGTQTEVEDEPMDIESDDGTQISQIGNLSKKNKVRGKKKSSRGGKEVRSSRGGKKIGFSGVGKKAAEPFEKLSPVMEEGQIAEPSAKLPPSVAQGSSLVGKGKRPTEPLVTRGRAKRVTETSEPFTPMSKTGTSSDGKKGIKRSAESSKTNKMADEVGTAPKRGRYRK